MTQHEAESVQHLAKPCVEALEIVMGLIVGRVK